MAEFLRLRTLRCILTDRQDAAYWVYTQKPTIERSPFPRDKPKSPRPQRSRASRREANYRNPAAVHQVLSCQKIDRVRQTRRLTGSPAAVFGNVARPEAIDGERNISPETQPTGPGHDEIIKSKGERRRVAAMGSAAISTSIRELSANISRPLPDSAHANVSVLIALPLSTLT
jgi:hypothetical protein